MRKIEFDLEKAKAGARLVTRDGRPARIICWDRLGSPYHILALVKDVEEESEESFSYTIDGKFHFNGNVSQNDLFILEEPVVRPYFDAEEFLNDMKEHGPMLKNIVHSGTYTSVIECNNEKVLVGSLNYPFSELQDFFTWQDGSPCGVCEEDTVE